MDLRPYLEFALEATWAAGRITLGYFQRPLAEDRKPDNTPVTAADRESEGEIRRRISQRWPDHAIIGEEYGQQGDLTGLTWVIDPIDGTRSFVCGVPLYATLLALVDGQTQRPVVGVIHLPALGETVYAAAGAGCFWNGRRARVSAVSDLGQAVALITCLNQMEKPGQAEAWERLRDATYIQRTWGDAYGYALVATGRAEIMVDPAMAVWDSAPLQVILEEAGGTLTDWQGNPTIWTGSAIGTNGLLFPDVMRLMT
jgi:histidinol phosphatase-like enzyme (inositol monophosphatase family)